MKKRKIDYLAKTAKLAGFTIQELNDTTRLILTTSKNNRHIWLDEWRPDMNIIQALEILESIKIDMLDFFIETSIEGWECVIEDHSNFYDVKIYRGYSNILSKAIYKSICLYIKENELIVDG